MKKARHYEAGKVLGIIKKHKRFLITSHINPEGDSVGSQLAMAEILQRLGKKYTIVNNDAPPANLKFLPGIKKISSSIKRKKDFDVVIALDCASLTRAGKVVELITKDKIIINIDHHISNRGYGHARVVDKEKSSTGEIIYTLARDWGIKLNNRMALYIYTAILTDTGSFKYSNTTSFTHKVVGHLLEFGVNPTLVSEHIYESNTLASRRLLGLALDTIKVSSNGKLAWLTMTKKMLNKTKAKPEDAEDFVNFARYIKGVKVAAFFNAGLMKNKIKVSFRSNKDVNVNKIAQHFGGGGHATASGCELAGSMKKAQQKVLAKIKKTLK